MFEEAWRSRRVAGCSPGVSAGESTKKGIIVALFGPLPGKVVFRLDSNKLIPQQQQHSERVRDRASRELQSLRISPCGGTDGSPTAAPAPEGKDISATPVR